MSEANALIRIIEIIKNKKGEDVWPISAAEHDIIYFDLDVNDVDPESDLSSELDTLGFHVDSDLECWALFV